MGRVSKRALPLLVVALAAMMMAAACTSRNRAPDFAISVYQGEEALGGKEVNFASLLSRGKPVVLNMWAGLCPPCREEMPELQEVYTAYQDRVLLFGLDVGPYTLLGSRDDGRALIQELGITFPVGTTYDPGVVSKYELLAMPTTFFIKANGEILRKWTGRLDKAKLTELVEELLAS